MWDGKVAGLERGLAVSGEHERVLLLTDSRAATYSGNKSCMPAGVARTGALGLEIVRRQGNQDLWPSCTWVRSYIGIFGNEEADGMAKSAASKKKSLGVADGRDSEGRRDCFRGSMRSRMEPSCGNYLVPFED